MGDAPAETGVGRIGLRQVNRIGVAGQRRELADRVLVDKLANLGLLADLEVLEGALRFVVVRVGVRHESGGHGCE